MKELSERERNESMDRMVAIAEHITKAIDCAIRSESGLQLRFNATKSECRLACLQSLTRLVAEAVAQLSIYPSDDEKRLETRTIAIFADLDTLVGKYLRKPS